MPCIRINNGFLCSFSEPLFRFGPLEIEWHKIHGPGFFWRGKYFDPHERSLLWGFAEWLYKRKNRAV